MSLQTKVIFMLFAVFTLYSGLDYGIQQLVIMPSFVALERKEAVQDIERAVQALDRELHHLSISATDWAEWDDTYAFVADRNPGYIQSNLLSGTLATLNINLMQIYDLRGDLIWGKAYDLQTGTELMLSEFAPGSLPADHLLLAHDDPTSQTRGVFMTDRGPMLVVSKPVITSEGTGPSRGALIMGRFLDAEAIAMIAEQARVTLQVISLREAELTREQHRVLDTITQAMPVYIAEAEQLSHVYTPIDDLEGQRALLLRADVPRAITARGADAIRFALFSTVGAGIVVLLVLLALLRHTVFKPVKRLTRHAKALGENDDLSARLALKRNDEIGILGREFDRMVSRLAETQRHLLERSYTAGVAEMASGVLHNIGNAVTPAMVYSTQLSQLFREAPAAELELAAEELAGVASGERQADLSKFVMLAGRELATLVKQAIDQLEAISRQLQHIQLILADQEKFSHAESAIESIELDQLLEETLALMDDQLRCCVAVEVDPSVQEAGLVRAARVALLQVFNNLILNAAQSIQLAQPPDGKLIIEADVVLVDGVEMIHLRFQDNGAGIAKDHIDRIFERGFTTKLPPASGLGLHWCAITVASMQGQLYAQSQGPDQGACLHLLLVKQAAAREVQHNRAA